MADSQITRMASTQADVIAAAEELYRRFHMVHAVAGVWQQAHEGNRNLHIFDIDVGRVLLSTEGHVGNVEDLHAWAGSF